MLRFWVVEHIDTAEHVLPCGLGWGTGPGNNFVTTQLLLPHILAAQVQKLVTHDKAQRLSVAVVQYSMPGRDWTYAGAVASERLQDWTLTPSRMFAFLGDVPKAVVADNLKAAVIKADPIGPGLNRTCAAVAAPFCLRGRANLASKRKSRLLCRRTTLDSGASAELSVAKALNTSPAGKASADHFGSIATKPWGVSPHHLP